MFSVILALSTAGLEPTGVHRVGAGCNGQQAAVAVVAAAGCNGYQARGAGCVGASAVGAGCNGGVGLVAGHRARVEARQAARETRRDVRQASRVHASQPIYVASPPQAVQLPAQPSQAVQLPTQPAVAAPPFLVAPGGSCIQARKVVIRQAPVLLFRGCPNGNCPR